MVVIYTYDTSCFLLPLGGYCNIMEWKTITVPRDSRLNGELIFYWGITKNKKLYFQE
jgi:hypothetical protein